MIEASLIGSFLAATAGAFAYALWTMNKPGERLFYTTMGLTVLGFPLYGFLWADYFTAFALSSLAGTPSVITFLVGAFVLPMATAIIGEAFNL